jgi:hypothetical protein
VFQVLNVLENTEISQNGSSLMGVGEMESAVNCGVDRTLDYKQKQKNF